MQEGEKTRILNEIASAATSLTIIHNLITREIPTSHPAVEDLLSANELENQFKFVSASWIRKCARKYNLPSRKYGDFIVFSKKDLVKFVLDNNKKINKRIYKKLMQWKEVIPELNELVSEASKSG